MSDNGFATRPFELDVKGRKSPEDMTDRELLLEFVTSLRAITDTFATMGEEMAKSGPIGMMKAFLSGSK